MTICTVFGNNTPRENKKPIEFVYVVTGDMDITTTNTPPSQFDYVVYISEYGKYDCMYAYYDGEENDGLIYFGHWNDGVV